MKFLRAFGVAGGGQPFRNSVVCGVAAPPDSRKATCRPFRCSHSSRLSLELCRKRGLSLSGVAFMTVVAVGEPLALLLLVLPKYSTKRRPWRF